MGKQLNVLKVKFIPETPILNLRIIRKVLNYSPLARYGDELTNQMFRHPAWQNLGSYPTAQNPFMSYNSNIWIMLFGWYLRSAIDQMMLKMYVRTSGGWSRQRIVKSRDIISEYNYPGAFDNFKEGLSGSAINPERLLTVFKNRAKGSSATIRTGYSTLPSGSMVFKTFRQLKILQLIDSLHSGGAERMCVNISNVLHENGHEVVLCATRYGGVLENDQLRH